MKLCKESILKKINIPQEGRLLVAFSGGEDSLFLLYVLSSLAPKRTAALYVNHNLRGEEELEREMELNRKNALELGVPFDIMTIPPGEIRKASSERNIGLEAAARDARYRALRLYADEHGFDYILTAHHMDDQTETVLMRMMEHSPFWKWGGIRERDGRIIRPILGVEKREIREVIEASGLAFSTDSTNQDTTYKRNYIRANILSSITEREREYISAIASNVSSFDMSCVPFVSSSPLFVSFRRNEYLMSLSAKKERTLYTMFAILGETERLSRRFLCEIERMIERGEKRVETDRYIIYSDGELIKGYRKMSSSSVVPFEGENTHLVSPMRLSYQETGPLSLEISDDILSLSSFRLNRPGDSINLVDGKRKISSLLKEFKIPYAVVMVYNDEVVAFFSSFLGGRDRLSSSLKGQKGRKLTITV